MADFVTGLATQIQVSPDLVAPMALSLASLAATGGVEYHGRPGHVEVPPLWTMTLAAPSERKSPILRALQAPFRRPVSSEAEQVVETQRREVEEDPDEDMRGEEWKRAAAGSSPGTATLDRPNRSERWRPLITTDSTPMGLMALMRINQERVGVVSDEGHPVEQIIAAVAHGGLDVILKGWSADTVTISRRDETWTLSSPQVVIALLIQRCVADSLLGCRQIVNRGLPQRMLMSSPPTHAARRSYGDSGDCPIHLIAAWNERVGALLALPRSRDSRVRELRLTADGFRYYTTLADRFDHERQNADQSPFMRQWFGKAHGQALRIAGLLALLGDPGASTIDVVHVRAAEAWVDYFAQHTEAMMVARGADEALPYHARRVEQWLRDQAQPMVSRSAITQALRCQELPSAEAWLPVFEMLIAKGYLRSERGESSSGGGRPSATFDVNPALFVREAGTGNPENPEK